MSLLNLSSSKIPIPSRSIVHDSIEDIGGSILEEEPFGTPLPGEFCLNYRNRGMTDWPKADLTEAMSKSTQPLVGIDLSYNSIISIIPGDFFSLCKFSFNLQDSLRMLNLSFNRLTFLVNEIGLFSQLRWIDLQHNELTILPAGLGAVYQLEYLDISFNSIASLPSELLQLTRLRVFCYEGNLLPPLPSLALTPIEAIQFFVSFGLQSHHSHDSKKLAMEGFLNQITCAVTRISRSSSVSSSAPEIEWFAQSRRFSPPPSPAGSSPEPEPPLSTSPPLPSPKPSRLSRLSKRAVSPASPAAGAPQSPVRTQLRAYLSLENLRSHPRAPPHIFELYATPTLRLYAPGIGMRSIAHCRLGRANPIMDMPLPQQALSQAQAAKLWATSSGRTLLHRICWERHESSARLGLLHQVISRYDGVFDNYIDVVDDVGATALHYASMIPDLPVVLKLLESGASLQITSFRGSSPLHFLAEALRDAAPATTSLFLQLMRFVGPSILNLQDHNGDTPIHIACKNLSTAYILEAFLSVPHLRLELTNLNGETAFDIVSKIDGQSKFLSRLAKRPSQFHPAFPQIQKFFQACTDGNLRVLEELLPVTSDQDNYVSADAQIFVTARNEQNLPGIFLAVLRNHPDCVRHILKMSQSSGHVLSDAGTTIAHLAARYDRVAVLVEIASLDPHLINLPDVLGKTPLAYAVFYSRKDSALQLLATGADVNAVDSDGFTILHHAIWRRDNDILALLLKHGADVTVSHSLYSFSHLKFHNFIDPPEADDSRSSAAYAGYAALKVLSKPSTSRQTSSGYEISLRGRKLTDITCTIILANYLHHPRWRLRNITSLDLSDNNLTTIPTKLLDFPSLDHVNLAHNPFSSASQTRLTQSSLPWSELRSHIQSQKGDDIRSAFQLASLASIDGLKRMIHERRLPSLNLRDTQGRSLLHLVFSDSRPVAERLLFIRWILSVPGFDHNVADYRGNTPLHLAAMLPCLQSVKLLLDQGVLLYQPNFIGEMPFHLLCRHCYDAEFPQLMQILPDQLPPIAFAPTYLDNHYPLHIALLHQADLRLVQYLAEQITCPPIARQQNGLTESPVCVALRLYNIKAVEVLNSHHDAVNADLLRSFTLLAPNLVPPSPPLSTSPLAPITLIHGELLGLPFLIDVGSPNVNFDLVNDSGWTLLHVASRYGLLSWVNAILARASPRHKILEMRTNYGWTPLHFAAFYHHTAICTALLEAGANPNATTPDGCTPLMLTTLNSDFLTECRPASTKLSASAAVLLQVSDPSQTSKQGNTILHYAVAFGNLALLYELVSKFGFDLASVPNKFGQIPLDLAHSSNASFANEKIRFLSSLTAVVTQMRGSTKKFTISLRGHGLSSAAADAILQPLRSIDIRNLDLSINRLKYVPLVIEEMANLRSLNISENPALSFFELSVAAKSWNPSPFRHYLTASLSGVPLHKTFARLFLVPVTPSDIVCLPTVRRMLCGEVPPAEIPTFNPHISATFVDALSIGNIELNIWEFPDVKMLSHTFYQIYSPATVLVLVERHPLMNINRTESWIQTHLPGSHPNLVRLLVSLVDQEHDRNAPSQNQILISTTHADMRRLRDTIVGACSLLPPQPVNFPQLILLAYIRNHLSVKLSYNSPPLMLLERLHRNVCYDATFRRHSDFETLKVILEGLLIWNHFGRVILPHPPSLLRSLSNLLTKGGIREYVSLLQIFLQPSWFFSLMGVLTSMGLSVLSIGQVSTAWSSLSPESGHLDLIQSFCDLGLMYRLPKQAIALVPLLPVSDTSHQDLFPTGSKSLFFERVFRQPKSREGGAFFFSQLIARAIFSGPDPQVLSLWQKGITLAFQSRHQEIRVVIRFEMTSSPSEDILTFGLLLPSDSQSDAAEYLQRIHFWTDTAYRAQFGAPLPRSAFSLSCPLCLSSGITCPFRWGIEDVELMSASPLAQLQCEKHILNGPLDAFADVRVKGEQLLLPSPLSRHGRKISTLEAYIVRISFSSSAIPDALAKADDAILVLAGLVSYFQAYPNLPAELKLAHRRAIELNATFGSLKQLIASSEHSALELCKSWYDTVSILIDQLPRSNVPSGCAVLGELYSSSSIRVSDLIPDVLCVNTIGAIPSISSDTLLIGPEVGRGAYGRVYRSELQGKEVALKVLGIQDLTPNLTLKALREFRHEVSHLAQLHSNYIVQLIGIYEDQPAIVLEFFPHGDLHGFILDPYGLNSLMETFMNEQDSKSIERSRLGDVTDWSYDHTFSTLLQRFQGISEALPELSLSFARFSNAFQKFWQQPTGATAQARIDIVSEIRQSYHEILCRKTRISLEFVIKVAVDLANALFYLSSINPAVVHLDIKPANIMVTVPHPSQWAVKHPLVKLADFGLAERYDPGMSDPFVVVHQLTNLPARWAAPEVHSLEFSPASDIYSLALVIWQVINRQVPFSQFGGAFYEEQLKSAILSGCRPLLSQASTYFPVELQQLLNQMWDTDPLSRPSSRDVIKSLVEIAKTYCPDVLPFLDVTRVSF